MIMHVLTSFTDCRNSIHSNSKLVKIYLSRINIYILQFYYVQPMRNLCFSIQHLPRGLTKCFHQTINRSHLTHPLHIQQHPRYHHHHIQRLLHQPKWHLNTWIIIEKCNQMGQHLQYQSL